MVKPRSMYLTGLVVVLFIVSALPVVASNSRQLQVSVTAASPVYQGQAVQIVATVQFANGTAVGNKATFTGSKVYYPNGTAFTLTAPVVIAPQIVKWTFVVPLNAPDGLYTATIRAAAGPNATWGLGSFTVNSQLASKSGLTALGTQLNSLSSKLSTLSSQMKSNFTAMLTSMTSSFSSLSSSISGDFGSIQVSLAKVTNNLATNFSSISGTLGTINVALNSIPTSSSIADLKSTVATGFGNVNSALGSLATSAQVSRIDGAVQSIGSQATGISNTQTYIVLPVVILALVLVAIGIIRKRA